MATAALKQAFDDVHVNKSHSISIFDFSAALNLTVFCLDTSLCV